MPEALVCINTVSSTLWLQGTTVVDVGAVILHLLFIQWFDHQIFFYVSWPQQSFSLFSVIALVDGVFGSVRHTGRRLVSGTFGHWWPLTSVVYCCDLSVVVWCSFTHKNSDAHSHTKTLTFDWRHSVLTVTVINQERSLQRMCLHEF